MKSSWDKTSKQPHEEGARPYTTMITVFLTAGLTPQGDTCVDWTLTHLLTFPSFLLGGMTDSVDFGQRQALSICAES